MSEHLRPRVHSGLHLGIDSGCCCSGALTRMLRQDGVGQVADMGRLVVKGSWYGAHHAQAPCDIYHTLS